MGIFIKERENPKVENRTVGSTYSFYIGSSATRRRVCFKNVNPNTTGIDW